MDMIKFNNYNVIVSDYQMNVKNGIELLKEIRLTSNIPFILFTGKSREEVAIEALNSGATFYLQKGVHPASQFAELSNMIKQAHYRYSAEQELKASEERYRLIFAGSPDAISVTRMSDGLIVSANDGFSKISNIPLNEIIGKKSKELNIYKNWNDRVSIVEALKAKGEIVNKEIEFTPKNGKIIGAMSASVIDINNEKYIVSITRDISERKRLEQEIRDREAKYKAIFEQSPIAIELYDENGILTHANPSCLKLFGVESIDVINKFSLFDDPNITDEIKNEMCKGETLRYQSVFDFEKVKNNNLYPTTKNGMMWVDTTITPMTENHMTIARYLIQIQDNTDRVLAIESSREANRKLNLLSSITRHDIKNQITTAEGHLALLEIKHPELLTNEHLQKAERSIRQIATMIQFTKEYENIGVNSPIWQNVKEMILNASVDLSLDNIRLIVEVPENLQIYADPLIIKVFHNLIHNAITHGLIIKNIRFAIEEIEGKKCIICEDDGVGVASDMKEALFAKAFGNGHGFGLFLSREILDITGITIKEIGVRGARFIITIPEAGIRYL
jgi:PAS domain S-box-containing protein